MQRNMTRRAASFARWGGFCFWGALVLQSGAVHSQVAVSESGQPGYSVPVAVPPGIAGLEPKISLQYSRGAQGGPFAVGWSLGGLSVITRCAWTQATDGQRRGVKYTSEDRYCLDGQRLILTTADGVAVAGQAGYGAAGSEYRTEKDSYARIRAYGATGYGPESFKVWTKSGLVYEYGTTADARITTTGRSPAAVMAWAVNRVADTVGNYMTMAYNVQASTFAGSAGTEWDVAAIRYTGNAAQQPASKVEFVYETRPDASEAFHEGGKSVSTRRLAAIRTYSGTQGDGTGGLAVQTLKLNYSTGLNSARSLLASTQVCAGSAPAKCLPRTEFSYASGPGGSFTALQPGSLTNVTLKNALGTRGVYQGDFNGDGRQDLLVWDEIPSQSALMLSNGDGTFSAPPQPLPAVQFGHSGGCHYSIIADFNVDGVSDVLQVSDPDFAPACASVPRAARIYIGSTSGVFQPAVNVIQAGGAALPLVRTDPVYAGGQPACYGGNAQICEGFTPTSITKSGRSFYVADLNGDGVPDILVTNSLPGSQTNPPTACASNELSCVFTGSAQTVGTFSKAAGVLSSADLFSPRSGPLGLPPDLQGTYKADRLFLGDINSDGLPDIVMRDSGKRYLGNGAAAMFSEASGTATQCIAGAEVLDVNGDGKWDLACMDYAKPEPYTVHINNGTGAFVPRGTLSNWAGRTCTSGTGENQTPTPCDITTRGHILYLGADYDGDGISDMLALGRVEYARPGSRNAFLKGQRDGTFTPISLPTLDNVELASGGHDVLIGDFMGRGSVDILRFALNPGANALYTRGDMQPADVLVSVKAPSGALTAVEYKPLTDASVYTRSTGAAYPIVDIAGAQWVASAVRAPNGRGGQIRSTFKYSGQRADLSGRGSLGFRTMEQTSPGPDGTLITSRTLSRQDYPYAGLPEETRRFVQSAGDQNWLSLTTSTYGDLHTLGCSDGASPRIYRPVLLTSNEQTRDLNGTAMATVATTNAGYNCYADPGTITVRTSDPQNPALEYVKVTTNTYLAPNIEGDAWLLGRLSFARQNNTVPDILPSTKTTTTTTGTLPSIVVQVTPNPMVAGQTATVSWTSANATSGNYQCTASGPGFKEGREIGATAGSDWLMPDASWVGYPSTCVFTVTGTGGTSTTSMLLITTLSPLSPKPTISVQISPNPMVAGQTATVSWTSANATSGNYQCTSAGPGFNEGRAIGGTSGSDWIMPDAAWVGYPSTCVFTVTGTGGTSTTSMLLITTLPPLPPKPTISVQISPNPMVAGQTATVSWTSANATSGNYQCTSAGPGFNEGRPIGGTSGSDWLMPDASWVGYPSTCVFTVTGTGGMSTTSMLLVTTLPPPPPQPTISVQISPNPMVAGQTAIVTWTSANATSGSYQCTSAGPGFNEGRAIGGTSGSDWLMPVAAWVGYPSNCVFTVGGPGGTAVMNFLLETQLPPPPPPPPTISASVQPSTMRVGQAATLQWTSTNATAVSVQCTAAAGGLSVTGPASGLSGTDTLTPTAGWVTSPSTCTWTATGPGGTGTYTHNLVTAP
jgi:hypothetical protein